MTPMNRLLPLLEREWLQHRFGWALLVLVPLGLALLMVSFGHIDLGETPPAHEMLPLAATAVSLLACTVALFAILWLASLIFVGGLARRDHGDRSVAFWLSLPVGHGAAIGVPLVVHLILVPAAALVLGLGAGTLVSAVVVTRVADLGAWFAVPWGSVAPAALALLGRLVAGVVLATLWLLPLLLLLVLLNAWFRRWGLVVLVAAVVGLVVAERVSGLGLATPIVSLLANAATAFIGESRVTLQARGADEAMQILRQVPAWAGNDLLAALRNLASPLLPAGLAAAAGFFVLLVEWRKRGASAGS